MWHTTNEQKSKHLQGDEIIDREEMLDMLDAGYSPEYVSLQKWRDIRNKAMLGYDINPRDVSSITCALCESYLHKCHICTLAKHFVHCNDNNSAWMKFRVRLFGEGMMYATNMINHLQYLVAVYGKYRRQE